jgi:hypothetical protein
VIDFSRGASEQLATFETEPRTPARVAAAMADTGDRHLLPEHEERLLGIAHRTSFPRLVVQHLNDWLDTIRAASRSNEAGPLAG